MGGRAMSLEEPVGALAAVVYELIFLRREA